MRSNGILHFSNKTFHLNIGEYLIVLQTVKHFITSNVVLHGELLSKSDEVDCVTKKERMHGIIQYILFLNERRSVLASTINRYSRFEIVVDQIR